MSWIIHVYIYWVNSTTPLQLLNKWKRSFSLQESDSYPCRVKQTNKQTNKQKTWFYGQQFVTRKLFARKSKSTRSGNDLALNTHTHTHTHTHTQSWRSIFEKPQYNATNYDSEENMNFNWKTKLGIAAILYSAQHGNQHKEAFAWIIYRDPCS